MMKQSAVFQQGSVAIDPVLAAAEELFPLRIEVVDQPEQIVEQWKILERFASDPFSNYAWVTAWYEAHRHAQKCSPVIILGIDKHNNPQFLLPLFRQKIGPFTILLRPGRTHSAYSSGLFSRQCRQMINSQNGEKFWQSIFSAIPGADAIAIDGVREAEFCHGNPLRFLPRMSSSNPSYEVQVSGEWEEFYKSKINRKARSNVRRCEKRFSERGELHFKTGVNKKERLELLRILLAQKAEQFKLSGIINPYDMENITSFYEKLVQNSKGAQAQSLMITALYLDEKPLAVILGMIQGSGFHGLIMSMVHGPLARFSPGRILLLRTMRHLMEIGVRKIDFGVGDANYKKEWAKGDIARHYVLAPLSLKGRIFVFGLRRVAALKALIKSTEWVRNMAKRVRWYSLKG